MSNANPFVVIEDKTWTLTIAPDDARHAVKGKGGNGQGALIDGLQKTPIAAFALTEARPRRMDHIHLSRFDGTDFCQWWGRAGDGFHYPLGKIMQIIQVAA